MLGFYNHHIAINRAAIKGDDITRDKISDRNGGKIAIAEDPGTRQANVRSFSGLKGRVKAYLLDSAFDMRDLVKDRIAHVLECPNNDTAGDANN